MNKKIYVTAEEIQTPICEKESQETAINWLREEEKASICTSDPTVVTKLKNIMMEDDSYTCFYYSSNVDKVTGRPLVYQFECDKSLISFRRKVNKKELSEEEKLNIVKRLRSLRNKEIRTVINLSQI